VVEQSATLHQLPKSTCSFGTWCDHQKAIDPSLLPSIGSALAIPSLRARGPYLAMVTIAFGFMVEVTSNRWSFTGGPMGIMSIPAPTLPDGNEMTATQYFWLIAGVALLSWPAWPDRAPGSRMVIVFAPSSRPHPPRRHLPDDQKLDHVSRIL
jgi:hypothetical protein